MARFKVGDRAVAKRIAHNVSGVVALLFVWFAGFVFVDVAGRVWWTNEYIMIVGYAVGVLALNIGKAMGLGWKPGKERERA